MVKQKLLATLHAFFWCTILGYPKKFKFPTKVGTFGGVEVLISLALLDTASTTFSDYSFIKLQNRTIRAQYVNIPLFIKMKTNEIGYLTYFGQFGFGVRALFNKIAVLVNLSTGLDLRRTSFA